MIKLTNFEEPFKGMIKDNMNGGDLINLSTDGKKTLILNYEMFSKLVIYNFCSFNAHLEW